MAQWKVASDANYTGTDNPIKMPWQDVFRNRPGPIGKGGIAGAFEQPASYLSDYAWRHYGGTEKTRALALKAQHDIPPWARRKIVKYYWFNKYYRAKKISKKFNAQGRHPEFQKGVKRRAGKSSSKYYPKSKPCKRGRFGRCWPNRRYRPRRTYRMCN